MWERVGKRLSHNDNIGMVGKRLSRSDNVWDGRKETLPQLNAVLAELSVREDKEKSLAPPGGSEGKNKAEAPWRWWIDGRSLISPTLWSPNGPMVLLRSRFGTMLRQVPLVLRDFPQVRWPPLRRPKMPLPPRSPQKSSHFHELVGMSSRLNCMQIFRARMMISFKC